MVCYFYLRKRAYVRSLIAWALHKINESTFPAN